MRALVQTVSRASVTGDAQVIGKIEDGLLVLIGITHDDTPAKAAELARKTYELRILDGETSAADRGAPLLVVSQFTLYGDARPGRGGGPPGHRVRRKPARPRRARGDRPFPGSHAGRERERRPADDSSGALARPAQPAVELGRHVDLVDRGVVDVEAA